MAIVKWMLMSVFGVVLLAGCAGYKSGESRTAGELVDDTAIQTRVKLRLMNAADMPGLRMDVDVARGVVTLSGRVASEEVRQRAVEITESVKGVVTVENRLQIKAKKNPEDSS